MKKIKENKESYKIDLDGPFGLGVDVRNIYEKIKGCLKNILKRKK